MKTFSNIQPRYIIAITLALALIMIISAYFELRQSREELYHVMHEEAIALIETIEQSSRNTILSTEQLELQIAERLFNNAHLVAGLDSLSGLSNQELQAIAEANNIFRINIFDRQGRRVRTSYTPHAEHAGLQAKHDPTDFIRPILEGETDRLLIGLKEARFTEERRFAVAIRRARNRGGAIVLNLDAADLLEFRKRVGIGKLLQDLGDNGGIEYVALQDSVGIIAASRAVQELSSFHSDHVLRRSLRSDSTITRTALFRRRDVFEALRPLVMEKETIGVLRIGLSMDEVRATESRMARRVVVMSLVLIGLGAVVLTAIVANQNYQITRQRLAAVESFTGSVLQHMHDAVITHDRNERLTLFNARAGALFGIPESSVIGKTIHEFDGTPLAGLPGLFAAAETDTEHVLQFDSGKVSYVSVSLSKTFAQNGDPESCTAVIRDLTEERHLREEISRKEKLSAMGELASGVAHEIRNPLNAIAMIAQRYEKEFVPQNDEQEYRSLTTVLKTEVRRVNAIIRQFLRFARPATLSVKVHQSGVFIEHIATVFRAQAKAKGVDFVLENSCDITLHVDAEQMTQALLNLLQNALDATSPGGTIWLRCSADKSAFELKVKDTGEGIPQANLSKIFDLYFSTKSDGTGLGLAITHQIISQHMGRIDVESTQGKGTEFTLHLPLRDSSVHNEGSSGASA